MVEIDELLIDLEAIDIEEKEKLLANYLKTPKKKNDLILEKYDISINKKELDSLLEQDTFFNSVMLYFIRYMQNQINFLNKENKDLHFINFEIIGNTYKRENIKFLDRYSENDLKKENFDKILKKNYVIFVIKFDERWILNFFSSKSSFFVDVMNREISNYNENEIYLIFKGFCEEMLSLGLYQYKFVNCPLFNTFSDCGLLIAQYIYK